MVDKIFDPDKSMSQRQFALLIGVSPPIVGEWIARGMIEADGTFREWIRAVINSLKTRRGAKVHFPDPSRPHEDDSVDQSKLDLNQEKAALTRTQREHAEHKLAIARGEFAPIGVLGDTLAAASAAVVAQFDQMEGMLSKTCPDLPESAKLALLQMLARARNAWIHQTVQLITDAMNEQVEEDEQ